VRIRASQGSSETTIAVAAIAAVSARKIVLPSDAEIHPAARTKPIRLRPAAFGPIASNSWAVGRTQSKCILSVACCSDSESTIRSGPVNLIASLSFRGCCNSGAYGAAGLLGAWRAILSPALDSLGSRRNQMDIVRLAITGMTRGDRVSCISRLPTPCGRT